MPSWSRVRTTVAGSGAHERFDDDELAQLDGPVKTAVIAPHGGGIETGTSELCLAVAGYHPATLEVTPPGGVTYDYWMFEGLRSAGTTTRPSSWSALEPAGGCGDGVAGSDPAGGVDREPDHAVLERLGGLPVADGGGQPVGQGRATARPAARAGSPGPAGPAAG